MASSSPSSSAKIHPLVLIRNLLLFFFLFVNVVQSKHHPNVQKLTSAGEPSAEAIDRREFLYEHNKIRAQFGEQSLKWNKTLAHYAHRFASKRIGDCQMIHSNGPYGENIFWGGKYEDYSAAYAVRDWASENKDYDSKSNSCSQNQMCGHYTQIVWKSTTRLGCARVKCNDGGVYVICNYDPPGNFVNENPFDKPPIIESSPPPLSSPPPPLSSPPIVPPLPISPPLPSLSTLHKSSSLPHRHHKHHQLPNSPPLPNKNQLPNSPPLPNQNQLPNSPPLPNQNQLPNSPPLPSKNNIPILPSLQNSPPLPNKNQLPNSPSLQNSPPLANKQEIPNLPPLHKAPPLPNLPPVFTHK